MRTVTYKSVLDGLLRLRGEEPGQAGLPVKLALAEFLAQALGACHEYWRWPELVSLERRYFRAKYSDALGTIAAGTELYFPPARKYYLCIREVAAGPTTRPAALQGGVWTVQAEYWAEAAARYSGDDWADGRTYAVGEVVRSVDFSSGGAATSGDWFVCHTAHTANTVFDGTKFGRLVPFRPYIAYEQTGETPIEAVIECYDRDPRSDTAALPVPYRLDGEGVRFAADQAGPIWVEYRRRCPDYGWSAVWAAGSYAAGTIVYHAASGEVYRAGSGAAGTDVPGTAALWVRAEVPYIFRTAAKFKAYALWRDSNGDAEVALIFDNNDPARPGKFQNEIEEQVWQYTKLQGQTGRVQTRPVAR